MIYSFSSRNRFSKKHLSLRRQIEDEEKFEDRYLNFQTLKRLVGKGRKRIKEERKGDSK